MNRPSRNTPEGEAYLDLQRLAKADGRATDELLALYALEGFLDRLSSSLRSDDLVLKGGVLLAAYDTRRPTRDIDLQATNLAGDADTVLELVRDIAASHKNDGLVYDSGSATAEVIRDEEEYSGVRVRLIAHLSRARIPFHVDVNVGDPVWPPPGNVEVARLLGGAITVRGYPLSMVFAEKIVTAVQRGTVNTRWRDYADIAILSAAHDVNGDELAGSIDVVATHRNATLNPLDEALAGYAEIAQNKWSAWVRKQRLTDRLAQDFTIVLRDVSAFARPAVAGGIAGLTWAHNVKRWMP
ncbi:MAG TPA: nucleotidyl transferase AbiEii/AbiGii toxin family protein [Dermatophilaceae bacterium]|nr:nucleotidyl transferase AbiEii/AbiGii toxin family protein [Dermatophilaceae bacterium]